MRARPFLPVGPSLASGTARVLPGPRAIAGGRAVPQSSCGIAGTQGVLRRGCQGGIGSPRRVSNGRAIQADTIRSDRGVTRTPTNTGRPGTGAVDDVSDRSRIALIGGGTDFVFTPVVASR